MALRNVRKENDPVLRKISKPVKAVNQSIITLLDDMLETMRRNEGVGLAAPQVGILKRIAVIDVGEDDLPTYELINPEIISSEGMQCEREGCLSLPNVTGRVERPATVTVKALNRDGEEFTVTGTGYLARALCHEIDHLNGIIFTDKVIDFDDEEHEEFDFDEEALAGYEDEVMQ